jgi:hypothetical protein
MPVLFTFTILVLIVLYGLAWHDKPAHEPGIEQRDKQKQPAPRQLNPGGKDA